MKIDPFDYTIGLKIKNIEAALRDREFQNSTCESFPASLTIADTTRCNLDCIMCHHHLAKTYTKSASNINMDFNLFSKIAKETFPHINLVSLSVSGEPFINPNFSKELELIAFHKVKLGIITNATLMPKGDSLRRLVNNLSSIIVSIDAASKKTYEAIRKGARFQQVIDNVKRLNRARLKFSKSFRPKLIFWLVLMRKNIEELSEYVRLAHALKADGIGLVHMSIHHEKLKKESLIYHKRLTNRCLKAARKLIDSFGIEVYNIAPLFSFGRTPIKKSYYTLNKRPCKFPWREAFIEVNGDVYPCCAPDKSGLLMGNVREQTFRQIWNGRRYRLLRTSFKNGNLFAPCKNCYQRLKDYTSDISGIYFPPPIA
ncbi:MAG: radical SAM protein [Candidatus Omnitrophica bacterium]|nr:radical SAM protein [Candidatus Omnitrophota bacterium]